MIKCPYKLRKGHLWNLGAEIPGFEYGNVFVYHFIDGSPSEFKLWRPYHHVFTFYEESMAYLCGYALREEPIDAHTD